MPPVLLEASPAAILHLMCHEEAEDYHIIRAITRYLSLADITTHSNIQQNGHVTQRARASRNLGLHNRTTINVPDHTSLAGLTSRLIPRKLVEHGALAHVGDPGAEDAVLVGLVVLAPVQAAVVLAVAVPRLGNVNLAVGRPGEGLLGEQPEGGPDAVRAGREDGGGEDAAVVLERLLAHEAGRRVPVLLAVVGDSAQDEAAIRRAELLVRKSICKMK